MKLFAWTILVLLQAQAYCNVLQVGENLPLHSIRQALLIVAPFDTVEVVGGHYREGNILINKPVTLLGKANPVLDGQSTYEVLTIKASFVIVEGFTIISTGYSTVDDLAGIKMVGVRKVAIRRNIFRNTHFAIYGQLVNNCLISENDCETISQNEIESGNAIHCWKSDSVVVQFNRLKGHRDGIYFEFVTNSLIRFNHSLNNLRYGLHFMFSNDNTYQSNIFEANGAGVAVMYTKNIKMLGNLFTGNWGPAAYGLLLKDISDSEISGNVIRNNTTGVYAEGSSRLKMFSNQFEHNGWALKMQANCMDNKVWFSNFRANTFDVTTNGSLSLNEFRRNYWDKYEGYDLNRDGTGDVPFLPVSLYGMIVERNPPAIMLLHSFMVAILEKVEKVLPTVIPESLADNEPSMKPFTL